MRLPEGNGNDEFRHQRLPEIPRVNSMDRPIVLHARPRTLRLKNISARKGVEKEEPIHGAIGAITARLPNRPYGTGERKRAQTDRTEVSMRLTLSRSSGLLVTVAAAVALSLTPVVDAPPYNDVL